MSEAETGPKIAKSRPSWTMIGATLTLLYFAGIWYFSGNSFLAAFSSMKANEIGDTLAGLFAPVAFLWLFIAVMVQAKELKLQREELRLTRLGFVEARDVARAQAEEARKQAAFIGEQTAILKEEAAQGRRLQTAGEATTMLRLMHKDWFAGTIGPPAFVESDPTATLHAIRRNLSRYERVNDETIAKANLDKRLRKLLGFAEIIKELSLEVDTSTQLSLNNSPLEEIIEAILILLARIEMANEGSTSSN